MKRISQFILSALVLLTIASCGKEAGQADIIYYYYTPEQWAKISPVLDLPDIPDPYIVNLPVHLSNTGLTTRPVEDAKAVLGRVLFYDKNLSNDGTISCASCHKQDKGFADDVAFSDGVADRQTTRNSFALASVVNFSAYYGTDINGSNAVRFFWDNRAETVAAQARGSLTNPDEMGMHMNQVVDAVKNATYYEPLFVKAFDGGHITEDNILEAIQHFVNSMGSYQSRFDEAAAGLYGSSGFFGMPAMENDFPLFTAQENRGKALYMTACASCHSQNMGRPSKNLASNGLDLNPVDKGVGGVSNKSHEMGQFKVPTLRNIALTAPYMHDGRFATLEEVVDFYSTGIQNHQNLDYDLRAGSQAKKFNYTAEQKADLLAFLHTLTDETIAMEKKFSDPFK